MEDEEGLMTEVSGVGETGVSGVEGNGVGETGVGGEWGDELV